MRNYLDNFPWRKYGEKPPDRAIDLNTIIINPYRTKDDPKLFEKVRTMYSYRSNSPLEEAMRSFLEKLSGDQPFCAVNYQFEIDNWENGSGGSRRTSSVSLNFILERKDADRFVEVLNTDPALAEKLFDNLFPGITEQKQLNRVQKDKLYFFDGRDLPTDKEYSLLKAPLKVLTTP